MNAQTPKPSKSAGESADSASLDTTIEVGLVCEVIERIHEVDVRSDDGHAIDCIAVGHYLGVRPQDAELALDRSISEAVPRDRAALPEEAGLITQYTDRGVIRGELAHPFFLLDPRPNDGRDAAEPPILLAIAGMGSPGRFGSGELIVVARELCWALGRLGRRHLATVLIGSGRGNLSVSAAVAAWIRGIKRAITGVELDMQLTRVTFVVRNGHKLREANEAIKAECARLEEKKRALIRYREMDASQLARYEHDAYLADIHRLRTDMRSPTHNRGGLPRLQAPTRLSVEATGRESRIGAITATAALPERENSVDPVLIDEVNRQLADTSDFADQLRYGRLLRKLVIPDEFLEYIGGDAPLSLLLDIQMAGLHWEMMAAPDGPEDSSPGDADSETGSNGSDSFDELRFLGTQQGLTRQLRALFAVPPQPPPPARRRLRVMIVANPAREHSLPLAEHEGNEIAKLFERFQDIYGTDEIQFEIEALVGPNAATRTAVLALLMEKSFDILHFAGHQVFATRNRRPVSGWLFSDDTYLTASELNRLDRVPEFVFSNSCHSGALPLKGRSNPSVATLAAAFFSRGVGNFVCTAWPIPDGAGLPFASEFYASLLGLSGSGGALVAAERKTMAEAMRLARIKLAQVPNGNAVWGAYQHYGNSEGRFIARGLRDEGIG